MAPCERVVRQGLELHHGGAVLARATTDDFGDFKFDALEPGGGAYEILVEHAEHGSVRMQTFLGAHSIVLDVRLGAVVA